MSSHRLTNGDGNLCLTNIEKCEPFADWLKLILYHPFANDMSFLVSEPAHYGCWLVAIDFDIKY